MMNQICVLVTLKGVINPTGETVNFTKSYGVQTGLTQERWRDSTQS